jgi:hypothetical protein
VVAVGRADHTLGAKQDHESTEHLIRVATAAGGGSNPVRTDRRASGRKRGLWAAVTAISLPNGRANASANPRAAGSKPRSTATRFRIAMVVGSGGRWGVWDRVGPDRPRGRILVRDSRLAARDGEPLVAARALAGEARARRVGGDGLHVKGVAARRAGQRHQTEQGRVSLGTERPRIGRDVSPLKHFSGRRPRRRRVRAESFDSPIPFTLSAPTAS